MRPKLPDVINSYIEASNGRDRERFEALFLAPSKGRVSKGRVLMSRRIRFSFLSTAGIWR